MKATGVLYKSILDEVMAISWPSPTLRDRAIAFVHFLIRKRRLENTYTLEYTDLAYVYFLQKLGSKYRDIIKPLLDRGILESTRYYRPGYYDDEGHYIKGQCLSYRLNPELMDDQVVKVVYENERRKQKCRDKVTMTTKRTLRNLRIPDMNSRELIQFVKKSLTDERILRELKIGDEIRDEVVMLKTPRWFKQEVPDDVNSDSNKVGVDSSAQDKILNQACLPNRLVQNDNKKIKSKWVVKHVRRDSIKPRKRVLIKDGKYCYVDYLDQYIKRKRRHLTQAYCDQLLRIKHRDVYADRNDTNQRLDSNITNLKNNFIGLLQLDGQRLSQIDLKNSQFRFFVMLLEQAERDVMFQKQSKEFPITKIRTIETAKMTYQEEQGRRGRFRGKPVTYLSILFDEFCTTKVDGIASLTADYQLFRRLVKTGTLYEHLQQLHWAETGEEISRREAKKMMFTVSFASYRFWPPCKVLLRKHFPSIIGLMDAFKKAMIEDYSEAAKAARESDQLSPDDPDDARACQDLGNASFAVMLQQAESLVFIDKILAKCYRRRIKALSKHDSILCRMSDKRKTTAVIVKVLNRLFGRFTYSLDIDGEVYAIKRRKRTRVGKVAKDFVMTIFGIEYRANAPPVRERNVESQNGTLARQLTSNKQVDSEMYRTSTGGILSPRIEALRQKILGLSQRQQGRVEDS